MNTLLGRKIGMTEVFGSAGETIPVTAVAAGPCPVLAIGDKKIRLGFEAVDEKKLSKPLAGYFKKIAQPPVKLMREFRRSAGVEYKVGEQIKADIFKPGDFVDVTGISIGKGFQGGMKRWHWAGGPESRGSTSHRRVGSVGSTTTPGRVLRGHHMPGHMGARKVTTQNLKVVKVDAENNLLLIKGAIVGHKRGILVIKKAVKKPAITTAETK